MYAIVEIGGKQHKVEKGSKILVDYLSKMENEGIEFKNVTLLSNDDSIEVGKPYLDNVIIKARVATPVVKGKKLIVYKYKAKSNYRRKKGHRQLYSEIEIVDLKKV